MPRPYKTPKLMVNENGWHEGARHRKEEDELLAKGFKPVEDVAAEESEEPEAE